jgi:hypothetical protein
MENSRRHECRRGDESKKSLISQALFYLCLFVASVLIISAISAQE